MTVGQVAAWLIERGAQLAANEDGEVTLYLVGKETDEYSQAMQDAMSGDPPSYGNSRSLALVGEFLAGRRVVTEYVTRLGRAPDPEEK